MILELSKIKQNNLALAKNGVAKATLKETDITETLIADAKQAAAALHVIRGGYENPGTGRFTRGRNVSFSAFLQARYGFIRAEGDRDQFAIVKAYVNQLNADTAGFSYADLYDTLGLGVLNKAAMESFLTTPQIDDSRFIIRELFLEAIRLGQMGIIQHKNWISRVQPIGDQQVKIPKIYKGNATPKILGEGEDMPRASVRLGLKTVEVFKVGTSFEITDEVVSRSSIDMVNEFLLAFGEDMGLAMDVLAMDTLVNGDQSDLSESAPSIGVNDTAAGVTWADVLRGTTRMNRLGNGPDRVITQEQDGIDLTLLPELKGFNGPTTLAKLNTVIGVPPAMDNDINGNTPDNSILLLNSKKAMAKLQWKSMMTERLRNPANQKDEIFVSDWVGFAIMRRDARLLINDQQSVISHNFPSYMDYDAYQNSPFRTV